MSDNKKSLAEWKAIIDKQKQEKKKAAAAASAAAPTTTKRLITPSESKGKR